MIKTKADLEKDINVLRKEKGNIHYSGYTVWNTKQIKDVLDKHDQQNGIVKVEISHGFVPGKKCYEVSVWYMPIIT